MRGDRILVVLGTLCLLAGVLHAALAATPVSGAAQVLARERTAAGTVEPTVRTERLPQGAGIDPETLELVGLDLEGEAGSEVLGWDVLRAYEYQEGLDGMPASIQDLDGKRITMAGFLLPLYEFDDIKEFNLVASHWSCCFGVPPGMSGWVHVKLQPGEQGLRNSTEPIRVTGTLRVGEHKEAGYVVSIYALEDATASVLSW